MKNVTRITEESQAFIDWKHWSVIQSEVHPNDDGRLSALDSYLSVNVQGRFHVYYRDNGTIIMSATNRSSIEAGRAFIAGWSRALLQAGLGE